MKMEKFFFKWVKLLRLLAFGKQTSRVSPALSYFTKLAKDRNQPLNEPTVHTVRRYLVNPDTVSTLITVIPM